MPTLSSVPEEDAKALLINHIEHSMPELVDIGYAKHLLNETVNQQIKSVLDELEGEAINYPKLSGDDKIVMMKSTIQKIRSRYE